MNPDFKEAFKNTKLAGSIAAGALDQVRKVIRPGISTDELTIFVTNILMITKLILLRYSIEVFQNLVVLQLIILCVMESHQIKY